MKTVAKLLTVAVAVFSLGACKQAQLAGPVADADILIDLLNQPGASFQKLDTKDSADIVRDVGVTKWATLTDNQKFIRLGSFAVDEELIDPDQLYFVTARYGEDTDADRNRKVDNEPLEVEGEWHAIMDGATLLGNGAQVSALTEAAYQYVRNQIGLISDEELVSLLDEFAQLVLADVNGDGVVTYADVLVWSRLYFSERYLGDITLLDKLANAITTNALDYIVQAAAESVWLNKVVMPILPSEVDTTPIGGSVNGDLVLSQAMSPYSLDAALTVNGDLYIEPGVLIRGHGRQIAVNGDAQIVGLPRQLISFDDLNITVATFGNNSGSLIRYVEMDDSSVKVNIQQFTMDGTMLEDSQLEVRNSAVSADNFAVVQGNIFEESQVVFYNRGPARSEFKVNFSNNLFIPSDNSDSTLTSKWEGPVMNLIVKNNSFNPDMRVLRTGFSAVLNVAENYWGVSSSADIDFDVVIPQKDKGEDDFATSITYLPRLKSPHPDTPVEPR